MRFLIAQCIYHQVAARLITAMSQIVVSNTVFDLEVYNTLTTRELPATSAVSSALNSSLLSQRTGLHAYAVSTDSENRRLLKLHMDDVTTVLTLA